MPEQFVNPLPSMQVSGLISFDFPCIDPPTGSIYVEQPSPAVNSNTYVAFSSNNKPFGNVNLRRPAIEELYGLLGNPPRQQGHPFMKEWDPLEPEDPTAGVHHDQILDIDRGFQINFTGRLSGSFIQWMVGRPAFSTIEVSAVAMTPVAAFTPSISLVRHSNWLDPQAEAPNVWYWRMGVQDKELMFTSHVRDQANRFFQAETMYKLVYQWKFWKYTGAAPYPANPPAAPGAGVARLGVSGFDEAISFEVSSATQ